MSLKVGIVGLPNVGKSTLFNAITNSSVEAANYPFATIAPNVGTVMVPDSRLDLLEKLFASKKKVAATIEFVDIAGLIAGASKGEGLGNAFLSNIRETDALVQVVRCFDDKEIMHVEGSVDPIRDLEIINLELMLADEQVIQKRLQRLAPKAKGGDKSVLGEVKLLEKLQTQLNNNQLLNSLELTDEEQKMLRGFGLLTTKPLIYVANVGEADLGNEDDNAYVQKLKEYAANQGFPVVKISAKIEAELSELEATEKLLFLQEIGATQSGLDQLIQTAYELLGLKTFFTAGPQEVHSWAFVNGMTAPQCAGIIHTDFARGFIKAEIYPFAAIEQHGSEKAVKDHGQIRLEGKTYVMQDGDVCFFKFNV
ncbi:hypothetical protein JN01_0506 [Entomoplasma freundtii]|uniref:Ribosome-binding ATPase YchF n=1 Tax=Entomoplasma freundtii TaxID=74700 RepID=A0A2K8NQM8_9MOLU|nr:redox-regulated ATPase YchF [Entomoplasma freundtii]ATZ16094.1 GTP-dependent nucleic acid-binding protein [Entomoplasma freundtii]TDY57005.1 hypothetical protein JN01_0506 [Entomoplasma freundtii]